MGFWDFKDAPTIAPTIAPTVLTPIAPTVAPMSPSASLSMSLSMSGPQRGSIPQPMMSPVVPMPPSMPSPDEPVVRMPWPMPWPVEKILNVLFPARCPVCEKPSDDHRTSPVCRRCWSEIAPLAGNTCDICANTVTSRYVTVCADCIRKPPRYTRAAVYGSFDGALKAAIRAFKFAPAKRLLGPLSKFLVSIEIPPADVVTAVPLTRSRIKERGFNQSLLLARELARHAGIGFDPDLIEKIKHTEHQTRLRRSQRLIAPKGVFRCTRRIDGMRVIIVDDVITTGATVNECARALCKAGAAEVYPVALARTVSK
jgi:ComF family protein